MNREKNEMSLPPVKSISCVVFKRFHWNHESRARSAGLYSLWIRFGYELWNHFFFIRGLMNLPWCKFYLVKWCLKKLQRNHKTEINGHVENFWSELEFVEKLSMNGGIYVKENTFLKRSIYLKRKRKFIKKIITHAGNRTNYMGKTFSKFV